MIEKYYNSAEASEFYAKNFNIKIHERSIQRWCRSGRLKSIKPGKSRYMTKHQLIDALKYVDKVESKKEPLPSFKDYENRFGKSFE